MSIYNLPDNELLDAYKACVAAVKKRLENPAVTYSVLADEIKVQENSLKKFIQRSRLVDNGHEIRRGAVFDAVYLKLVANGTSIEVPADGVMSDPAKQRMYSLLLSMLGVGSSAMNKAATVVFSRGRFICLRNSTDPSRVQISEVAFKELGNIERPIWEFSHHFTEGDQSDRKSDGPAIVMNRVLYLFGDVQRGSGVEAFVLRQPTGDARFLVGFLLSIDDSHTPFVANVVLVKADDEDNCDGQSDLARISAPGFLQKEDIKSFCLGTDPEFGRKLLKHLKIEASDTVLRISKDKLIRDLEI